MQTWQRLTRERKLPALSVSGCGVKNCCCGSIVDSQKLNLLAK